MFYLFYEYIIVCMRMRVDRQYRHKYSSKIKENIEMYDRKADN